MEEQELQKQIQTVDEQVTALAVKDKKSFELAGEITHQLDGLIKEIKNYWKEPIEKAHQAHKALTAKRGEMLNPVESKRRILSQRITMYLTEQERIRQEQQRKFDEERRKEEEAERRKLEAKAQKAEEKGKIDKADALREKADDVYVPPTIAQSEIEKTTRLDTGIVSTKKDIEVTIINPIEVIKQVAMKEAPLALIEIKESKLKTFIKDNNLTSFPGCSIKEVVKGTFRGN